ncbi:MAG: ribonuclease HII [Patescibacteria group bacterium]
MMFCGMDEVGRGAFAGPLVGAAVILNSKSEFLNPKLKDSKKLTARQREKLYNEIFEKAEIVKIEMISVRQINSRGIGWANKEVFRRLIRQVRADEYIVDGNLKIKGATSVVKADNKYPEVMAASIIAKVTRDRLMKKLHEKHPKYGWVTNVGYGTKFHICAIRDHGSIRYHREVFVQTALKNGLKLFSGLRVCS